ncbi:serine/threonine-protein kinase [Pseudofrankia sp. BMG5.36]|uniref:serine/threonine-protein kinase n=1 Tax=Pseudofrankia sp. BMG5.36 TaxID=1834512 RepID=UPI0008DB3094|nr:serine/threonine-protein kinase [Pseudofrankia sp. BMG5.36]OHV69569.1 hypothetical protein BCD48_34765 [Pseudofrankia sp. BMG5.36]
MESLLPADPSMIGGYRLVARLGAGGMGRVYLARSATGEDVALKVIKPELLGGDDIRRRFAEEIQTLRLVYGARNARFEADGMNDDPPWLAFEYVPGRTLREHVEQDGPLAGALVAVLGMTLTDALDKLHRVGLLHRDLKPQNVMLGPDGPKVIDFGLAVLEGQAGQNTASGAIVGTPAYLPPEQATGGSAIAAAADVYALGATLVYAATAHTLYQPRGIPALIRAITDPVVEPDLSGVPGELTGLLAGMVAYDPARRPTVRDAQRSLLAVVEAAGSISEMRRQLVAATYVAPIPATPDVSAADGVTAGPGEDDDVPGPVRGVAIDAAPEPTGSDASLSLGIPAQGRGPDTAGDGSPPRPAVEAEAAEAEAEAEAALFDPETTTVIGPPLLPPGPLPALAERSRTTAPSPARTSRPLQIGWLVDELRVAYARDAPL